MTVTQGIHHRAASLLIGLVFAGFVLAEPPAGWVAGDFHNHSFLTDGKFRMPDVLDKGLGEFGLTWMVNSEHGGGFSRNPDGVYWDDPALQPAPTLKGDRAERSKHRLMWRWQSLMDYSFPLIAEARSKPCFAGKVIMQGLEFNCPGHEHVSTGILADDARALAEFEYRFDASDADTSGGPEGRWTGKVAANDHAKALDAIRWLQAHHPGRSWFIVNHPERKRRYRIEDFRDFNTAAPDVAFGFEAAPGHQKIASVRGEYGPDSFRYADSNMGGATYGGVGVFAARVGGVWDALLGEDRRFFAFANSDFHNDRDEFFPGEYQKNYVRVDGPPTPQAILDAMRAGRAFFAAGDLVDAIELTAAAAGRSTAMGGTLEAPAGAELRVCIRLHDPAGRNNLGDRVEVDHVDLIAGRVAGPAPRPRPGTPTSSPACAAELNPSTRVIARFDRRTWVRGTDGWITANFTLARLEHGLYLRLRGTNLPAGREFQTDPAGEPLNDAVAEANGTAGPAHARADLWFYSNPLFVRVR